MRNFAPVLVRNFYGDCLTDGVRLMAFAVELLQWLPDWPRTTYGFCCETLHQFWCETFTVIAWLTTYDYWLLLRNFAPVLVWNFYGDCLTDCVRLMAFAVKLLRWLPDWPRTTYGFCCKTLHQFWCETFTVIKYLTHCVQLMAFAAKLCTSFGVKLLWWLPDWLPTTYGFCCETLDQLWCETFTVIAWLTAYHLWLLLRNFAPVLVWNFYGDCLTDYLRLLV